MRGVALLCFESKSFFFKKKKNREIRTGPHSNRVPERCPSVEDSPRGPESRGAVTAAAPAQPSCSTGPATSCSTGPANTRSLCHAWLMGSTEDALELREPEMKNSAHS